MNDDYVVAADYGGDDHGPHKEVPPPEIFASEEEELKWLATTAGRLKQLGDQVMTTKVVEPRGHSFWSGPVKEDPPPGRITEAKLEEDWKQVEKSRNKFQEAALSIANPQKTSELAQILDCRTKRGGDELTQEVIKKRRTDLDAEVKRLKAKQEKEEQELREAAATAEREEKERRKQKEAAAKMKAIEYEACKGKSAAEIAAWKDAYKKEQDELAQKAKAKREAKIARDKADKDKATEQKTQDLDEAVKAQEQEIRDKVALQIELAKKKAAEEKKAQENAERIAKQEDDKKKRDQEAAIKQQKADYEAKAKKAKEDQEEAERQKKADEAKAQKAAEEVAQKKIDEANAAAQNPAKLARDALNLTKAQEVQMNNWTVIIYQGGHVNTDHFDNNTRDLYNQWEPWHTTHFRKAPTTGVPDVRLRILDNLNARAFVAEQTPLQFVTDQGYVSVDAFIDAVIREMGTRATRLPAVSAGEHFDNGLWARAYVERTTQQVVAKSKGYQSIMAMRAAKLAQLASYPRGSKEEWEDHHQFVLDEVGDYEAELMVAEEKVRDHKANRILPATVPGNTGFGFEF